MQHKMIHGENTTDRDRNKGGRKMRLQSDTKTRIEVLRVLWLLLSFSDTRFFSTLKFYRQTGWQSVWILPVFITDISV